MDATELFHRDGDQWVPTELSRGPWDRRHCHGGPVSALLVRAVERVPVDGPAPASDRDIWQLARCTIELTRPVPVLRPLALDTVVERPGRKVSLVAAVLRDGDTDVAHIRALRIRREAVAVPAAAHLAPAVPLAPPERATTERMTFAPGEETAFHRDACEHRPHRLVARAGTGGVWIRLLAPVVAGEEPSGAQRAAAAADFGNGVSGSLPHDRYLYINPDLTLHLLRPVVGEWIGMRTASWYGDLGAGLAESALFDVAGRVGRSCQSLLVEER
ncbi:MAG: thioesterase family protein [Ilumatobacteraceae bacterium]